MRGVGARLPMGAPNAEQGIQAPEISPPAGDPLTLRLRAARNLAVDATATEVAKRLAEADVPSILLKGRALNRWLYGDGTPRFYVDCDLLVPPAELSAAEQTLRNLAFLPAAGSIPGDRPSHAVTWTRHDGAMVDLHRTIFGPADADQVWEVLSGQTVPVNLGGSRVESLNPSGLALLVALHACQHGRTPGKTLEDLERCLDRAPLAVWTQAALLADRLQATPAFSAGLGLLPEGRELARRLRLPAHDTVETALRSSGAPAVAFGLDWLTTKPGLRAKALFVARKLVPPPSYMRARYPIAADGAAGLATAYGNRAARALRQAPAGLVAWRRATRQAGSARLLPPRSCARNSR